jgi:flagellar hook-length control protein FliK
VAPEPIPPAAALEAAVASPAAAESDPPRGSRGKQRSASREAADRGRSEPVSTSTSAGQQTEAAASAAAGNTAAPAAEPVAAKSSLDARSAAPSGDLEVNAAPGTRSESAPAGRAAASARQQDAGSDQADRVRFVQRVARAFEAAHDRGGHVRLRLHPPELGSLRVELTVRGGVMNARVEAESPAAQSLLLENLPALRERLAEHDIKVQRFDVDLFKGGAEGSPQQPGGQSHHSYRSAGTPPASPSRRTAEPERAPPVRGLRRVDPQRLDITI